MMEQALLSAPSGSRTRHVPSPVSVKDLVKAYDTLVARLNELHSDGKDNPLASPSNENNAIYDSLILVCRLLLWTPLSRAENNTMTAIPWTKPQLETIQSTIQAACAWRRPRASTFRGHGRKVHCGEYDVMPDDSPQISHVRIYQDPLCKVAILEWTAALSPTIVSGTADPTLPLASDTTTNVEEDDDDLDDNGVLWVASLDRQELVAEEDELWRMAQTPIPLPP
jgi:hypothetical protein